MKAYASRPFATEYNIAERSPPCTEERDLKILHASFVVTLGCDTMDDEGDSSAVNRHFWVIFGFVVSWQRLCVMQSVR